MMRNELLVTLGAMVVIVAGASVAAQEQPKNAPTSIELTGCVSVSPTATGQFSFVDAASGGTYRLNGKGIKKYAGQRVRIVGDPPNSKKLKFRTGLWPSPNVAAQAGALDPAQESIARHSSGTSGMPDATPELKVVRVHGVDGACQ
jgi:hypothetical protein